MARCERCIYPRWSRVCPASKTYYERKRNEGKGHKQALLALARRRINVLWAMLHDSCFYEPQPVAAGR